jgi:hypothetical protein
MGIAEVILGIGISRLEEFVKRIASRRPSPTTVIACLALFLALGGGVYAAAKGSKISGNKIKKSSIAGNRLKKDTLTGKQIKESTLGTVPSAGVANSVSGLTRFNFTVPFGGSQTFLTAGPFSFTAVCAQNASTLSEPVQNNQDIARILISTNTNGMVFDAFSAKRGEDPTKFLDTNTPEKERIFDEVFLPTGKARYDAASNDDGAAYQPNGVAVSFDQDGFGIGINVFGPGCFFHGFATVEG